MKNVKFYEEVVENGQLSPKELHQLLADYIQQVEETIQELKETTDLTGDDLADEFFNTVDEKPLLTLQQGEHVVEVVISRFRSEDEEGNDFFGAVYLVEKRDNEGNYLGDVDDDPDEYELGQEETLIQALYDMGLDKEMKKN